MVTVFLWHPCKDLDLAHTSMWSDNQTDMLIVPLRSWNTFLIFENKLDTQKHIFLLSVLAPHIPWLRLLQCSHPMNSNPSVLSEISIKQCICRALIHALQALYRAATKWASKSGQCIDRHKPTQTNDLQRWRAASCLGSSHGYTGSMLWKWSVLA